jgi:molybdate transport system ATP-binding protein
MDEPLASLDEGRKAEILPYIERLRDEIQVPIVYVSHSIPEVTRLATTMVLLAGGKVIAAADVAEVMGRIDLSPLTGRYEAGGVLTTAVAAHDPDYELTTLRSAAGDLRIPQIDRPVGTRLRVHVRARDVMIALKRPEKLSALNILAGRVAAIGEPSGPIIDVRLDLNGEILLARVTRLTVGRLGLQPGLPVFAIIKSIALDHQGRSAESSPGAEEITL